MASATLDNLLEELDLIHRFQALSYPAGTGYIVYAQKPSLTLAAGQGITNLLDNWKQAAGFIRYVQVFSTSALTLVKLEAGSHQPRSGVFSQSATIAMLFANGAFNPDPSGQWFVNRYDPTGAVFAVASSPAPPGIPFSGKRLKFSLINQDVVTAVVSANVYLYLDEATLKD